MKIIKSKADPNCRQGVLAKQLLMDGVISKKILHELAKIGVLEYVSEYSKLYTLTFMGRFILKGLEGKKSCKIIFYGQNTNKIIEYLEQLLADL